MLFIFYNTYFEYNYFYFFIFIFYLFVYRNHLSVIEEATEQSSLSSQSIDPRPIPSQSQEFRPIPLQSIKSQKLGSQSIKQTERHLSPPSSKSNLETGSPRSQLLPGETKSKKPVSQFSRTFSQDFDLDCLGKASIFVIPIFLKDFHKL